MTRLAFILAHYAAAALFVAPILAHATGMTGPPPDDEVARWITEDVIADDRSALTLDGEGVRFVGQEGGGGIVTPTPAIPLPAPVWLLAGAVGVLIWKGWK